jgi:hypothetical protein
MYQNKQAMLNALVAFETAEGLASLLIPCKLYREAGVWYVAY